MSQQSDVYFLINWLSTCFRHYYAHHQENKTVFNTACGGACNTGRKTKVV